MSETKPIRNRFALLVGINRYVDYDHFPLLNYCVKDVQALGKLLTQLGYQVLTLHTDLDRDDRLFPTRENIEAEVINLCASAQQDDLVLLHFSGHGLRLNDRPYLIAHDTRLSNLNADPQKGLGVDWIEQQLRESCQARRLVLFLDACQSGVDMSRSAQDLEFIKRVYDLAEGFALLAASTSDQKAYERDGYGAFTYHLLQGLAGKAKQEAELVTVSTLSNYVLSELRARRFTTNMLQEPTQRIEGMGDIILADYRSLPTPQLDLVSADVAAIQPRLATQPAVKKLRRSQQLRLEVYQQELANAEQDFVAVKERLLVAMDPITARKLQQMLDQLAAKMDDLETQIEDLESA